MPEVSLTLDGKKTRARSGSTILDVARREDVEIPTLCHDPRLKPTAACRLCLVEVEGGRGPVPACATQTAEGMVVKTTSEALFKGRQIALELLLSDHYGDCVAPCKLACPAGIDVQGYVALVANGQYPEALKLIKERNPLPLSVGRVCPRFCEAKCRRNLLDGPVAIDSLKRFVADYEVLHNVDIEMPRPRPSTGKRVAVIGGGPAGLSAAYYLALDGHQVSIFESSPHLGGMMRYGIPEYRLPKATMDREIAAITGLCREVRCNAALGRDYTIDSLKAGGFDAIFLALGAQVSQKMGAEGEDQPGVLSGIGFLRDVALGKKLDVGQKVVVIGGGNTAMDAARTALRLKASEVTIAYRRSRDEMPANDEEVEQAEQEGVHFQFLAAPLKVLATDGRASAVEFIRMALGAPDASGRRRPEPIPGSGFTMKVDTVIAAIGQTVDASGLGADSAVKVDRRGGISVDPETMTTLAEGVFAGGDCSSGPATVIEAIAAGRRAAQSMDRYLRGEKTTAELKPYNCSKGELHEIDVKDYETRPRIPRTKVTPLNPELRKVNFNEIEPGFSEAMARTEAGRCLSCGCQDAFECKLRDLATEYRVNDKKFAGRRRHLPVRDADHPHIVMDPNKCVLCGRCVRICGEVEGVGALGFANRGFRTTVEPALGMPLCETACEACGQCVSTCPTGALTPKVALAKPGPWQLRAVPTVCPYCGVGCNLELNLVGEQIVNVTSPLSSPNEGNLCKRGAFNPTGLNGQKRLRTPLIKRGDSLVEVSWPEAIELAARGLKQIRDHSGGQALAVLASAQLTNEEHYLAQKLARAALGTNNVGCLTAPTADGALALALGKNASTCSFDDLPSSDLVVVYGCDVAQDYPVVGLKIRQAVAGGTRLVTLSPRQTRLDAIARVSLRVNRRTGVDLLQAMLGYIMSYGLVDRGFVDSRTANYEVMAAESGNHAVEKIAGVPWAKPAKIVEAAQLLVRARRPVVVLDAGGVTADELDLIANLMLATGNVGRDGAGLLLLRTPGNAQGLIDMGVSPANLPGQEPIGGPARARFESAWGRELPPAPGSDIAGISRGIESGEVQGVLVLGGDAAGDTAAIFEVPIFSVLMDSAAPEKPPYPDVVLPAANFAESEGTFTSCERRIQRVRPAQTPPGGRQNWEILAALGNALGYAMPYRDVAAIEEEIAALVPLYSAIRDTAAGQAPQWTFCTDGRFWSADGLARFRPARLAAPVLTG